MDINKLKTILKEIVGILEAQALAKSRASDDTVVDEQGRQLSADQKDEAVVKEYNAIRERIDELR